MPGSIAAAVPGAGPVQVPSAASTGPSGDGAGAGGAATGARRAAGS